MKRYLSILLFALMSVAAISQSVEEINQKAKKFLAEKDFEKAAPLLKQAASLGNAEAQYNLGFCYQAGIGISKNQQEAIAWYLKAAEKGFTDALYQLMMAYGNGEGVPQDVTKAFTYALQCAENNDATCMWNVVNCYYSGMGVEKSMTKMVEWATRLGKMENPENLAKSGYITSTRLQLANFYKEGKEIKQDLYLSYLWFLIYNEFKVDFSILQQQQVIKDIQDVESLLTPEQRANGKMDAEKLFGRPLKNIENLYKTDM